MPEDKANVVPHKTTTVIAAGQFGVDRAQEAADAVFDHDPDKFRRPPEL